MITSSFILLYTFFISFFTGIAWLILLRHLFKTESVKSHSTVVVLFGLCCIAALLALYHLFHSIDASAHIILLLFNTMVLFNLRKEVYPFLNAAREDFFGSKIKSGFTLLLFIAALINIAGRAGVGDIADYHLQAVQWDERYKVVPGLGNLRRQLGNNSNWFLLHAFSGCWFTGAKSVYVLNALLLVVAGVYFTPAKGERHLILKAIILFYICLMSFRKYVGAVTNDYAVTIFTLVAFTEWISASVDKDWRRLIPLLFIFIMLPAFKLSAITMLVIPACFILMILKHGTQKNILVYLLLSGIIVYVPWLVTNYLQSGYLCYPIVQTGFVDSEWKMNPEMLHYELLINKANERVPGVDAALVMQMPFTTWFVQWIKHLDGFSFALLFLFGLVSVYFILVSIFKIHLRENLYQLLMSEQSHVLILTIVIALPIWFLNAPATRFVFGHLVFGLAWGFHWMYNKLSLQRIRIRPSYIYAGALFMVLLNTVLFTRQYLPPGRLALSWVKPLPYSQPELSEVDLKKGKVYMPSPDGQCWDAPIPCTSILDSNLKMRGSRLDNGFVIK